MAGLAIHFQDDIRAALLAGVVAKVNAARAAGDNVEYLRGVIDHAHHQALAFGIDWPGLLNQARCELDAGGLFLLDRVQVLDAKVKEGQA